jgi:hypothetical protein
MFQLCSGNIEVEFRKLGILELLVIMKQCHLNWRNGGDIVGCSEGYQELMERLISALLPFIANQRHQGN